MVKAIKEAQKLLGVKFNYDKENNLFSSGFELGTRIEEGLLCIFITEEMQLTTINCDYHYEISEAKKSDILEYIARVNNNLLKGNFNFDFESNSPSYQFTMFSIKDPELIAYEINRVINDVIEFADGFVEVNEDGVTPEEAVNKIIDEE